MITVVIPTLNAEAGLPATLTALVPAAVDGLVREVIVVDGGSTDFTCRIAEEMGADVISAAAGRGGQLKAGAGSAHMPWILFLHADTVLEPGWEREVSDFIRRAEMRPEAPLAAAFRFGLDDIGMAPRIVESMVRLRCLLLALPFGDQGLLISRRLYDKIGGYAALPLMEDVDIVRRIGRGRLVTLRTCALTSARRYHADGYFSRILRNQLCLMLYFAGVPTARIARLYGPRPTSQSGSRAVKSA